MNAETFVENYIMYDSLIDKVEADSAAKTVVMLIDFAFWMQKDYVEGEPETGVLKVTFSNVSQCIMPSYADWQAVSILETRIEEDAVLFALLNDMTDDYSEIRIKAGSVTVERI